MSIEKNLDIQFLSGIALREKQIQQNYRPIIAVHKWFARRPGSLFRGLLLSEFASKPLHKTYFSCNQFRQIHVADPFMGGGTPLIEANRLGCDITGFDINPMAWWIVRQEIEHINLVEYSSMANQLRSYLEEKMGHLYQTVCQECGFEEALVKYFLWVKIQTCQFCNKTIELFPGYIIAKKGRHPKNVIICSGCGSLNEVSFREKSNQCKQCHRELFSQGSAKRNRCVCPNCGKSNSYPNICNGPLEHRLFAIEYYCPICRSKHKGRYFKKPDSQDYGRYSEASLRLQEETIRFIPEEKVPKGDETDRLHRWGYSSYRQMFNHRQLLALEMSARFIVEVSDVRVRNALATNLSDLVRYQNMLCRYDTMALKSLDIFSVHGFPVGLIQCESNILGIPKPGGSNIGSGGWSNIINKYYKAKAYCDHPFEVRYHNKKKKVVTIHGEWIGEQQHSEANGIKRQVNLYCQSGTLVNLPPKSLDAVFTDPPYFGNVQYAELIDFCYIWLRRLVGTYEANFLQPSTRNTEELTGNVTMERDLAHFTEGLSKVFQRMTDALKPGSPFAFTYHHNKLEAYLPIAVSILDSGLTCSASIPCPAEMGASIHINKTGSSIIDTIFVCRTKGTTMKRWLAETPEALAEIVRDDLRQLEAGGVKSTRGDMFCITYGHLIRLAIWRLRKNWKSCIEVTKKIDLVEKEIHDFGGFEKVVNMLQCEYPSLPRTQHEILKEKHDPYHGEEYEVSF